MADVITVTTGTVGAAGSAAAELINQMQAMLLRVAEYDLVLEQFAQKDKAQDAKTVQWTRVERLPVASSPQPLTEGVNPDAVGLTINRVTATLAEYGNVVMISNLAQLTARHNLVQAAIKVLGRNAGQVRDQIIYNTLDIVPPNNGFTSVFRVNNRPNDAAMQVGDQLSFAETTRIMTLLASRGATPFPEGMYALVVPSDVYGSLLNDPNYLAAQKSAALPTKIYRGEVGALVGMRVVHTNSPAFVGTSSGTTGNSNRILTSFALGEGAFAVTDLEQVRIYVNRPGGPSDPLHRRWTLGWAMTMQAVILDNNFGMAIRASGVNATAV